MPYGGARYELPAGHKAGLKVPQGGSSCANCSFLGEENTCRNHYFIQWNGGNDRLPAPADEYCSDWWEEGENQMAPNEEEYE